MTIKSTGHITNTPPQSGQVSLSTGITFVVAVHSLSCAQLFAISWTAGCQGFPVLHYIPKFVQTHVHWIGDVIQPSHSLLPPSSPDLNFFQHQGLFQWVGTSWQVAKGIIFSTAKLKFHFRGNTSKNKVQSFRMQYTINHRLPYGTLSTMQRIYRSQRIHRSKIKEVKP